MTKEKEKNQLDIFSIYNRYNTTMLIYNLRRGGGGGEEGKSKISREREREETVSNMTERLDQGKDVFMVSERVPLVLCLGRWRRNDGGPVYTL